MPNRNELQCTIHPFGSLAPLKYVVVCSFYNGRYLLSRHKKRDTWETQGGHIEPHESPLDAAKRELFEESGVHDATLYPVCDYFGFDSESASNGTVFYAEIHHLGSMPESEMKEVKCFDRLPDKLTYPNVTPALFSEAERTKKGRTVIREAIANDLGGILNLYLHLHETSVPADTAQLRDTWAQIIDDPNYHLIVCEVGGRLVASCTCVIIPNLTRNVRPYALVENVVTHADYRGKGYATACLHHAKQLAADANCYKIMLLTGSKETSTHNFYRNAGYSDTVKTAFVQKLD